MVETNPAGWFQNAGATHTAVQLRTYAGSLLAGRYASGTEISRTRGGVHSALGGQLQVQANGTPNMSVNVLAGMCYVPGTESTSQGVYFCHNPSTVNLSIATAPGTGLSRIDLVVAQVQDSFYSTANNAWALAVVTGTAAASPVAPTAPNDSITLAQVAVGANVTSIVSGNITDTRYYAASLGGAVYVTNYASSPPALNLYPAGQLFWDNFGTRFLYSDGTNPREVSHRFIGETINNSSTVGSITVTETVVNSLTFTALASPQRYKVVFEGSPQSTSVNDTGTLRLRWKNSGTVDTTGTQFRAGTCDCNLLRLEHIEATFNAQAAGTLTVVASLIRATGSGTLQLNGSATQENRITVWAVDD